MPKGDFRKLVDRKPLCEETKDAMRQFTVVCKIAIQTGRIRPYVGGRGGRRGGELFNITTLGMEHFQLTQGQAHTCKARALDQIHAVNNLDNLRPKQKRGRRYGWEYLDAA